jgi:cupin 2 domain-containing protein
MKIQNIFSEIPAEIPEELFQEILKWKDGRIERIVSKGHATPEGQWYDQEQAEWVLLLAGKARLLFEGNRQIELKPGDYLKIPAHSKHRVSWTDPTEETIWLAVHYDESFKTRNEPYRQ